MQKNGAWLKAALIAWVVLCAGVAHAQLTVAVQVPADGAVLPSRRVTITGTATVGALVHLTLDGSPLGSRLVDASGRFTLSLDVDVAEGPHELRARAELGLFSAEVLIRFRVDITAPDTQLLTRPDSSTRQTSAQFSFSASEQGVRYQCSLDSAAFAECSNPVTFTSLAEGSHALQVRAIDSAGNMDPTPASHTWAVDLTPPETTVTLRQASRTGAEATFEFSSTDPTVSFECKLNQAPFEGCTSPVTFSNLEDGTHTLQVRAKDSAGNEDGTPASFTWEVDTLRDTGFAGGGFGCSAGHGGNPALALLGLLTLVGLGARHHRA